MSEAGSEGWAKWVKVRTIQAPSYKTVGPGDVTYSILTTVNYAVL